MDETGAEVYAFVTVQLGEGLTRETTGPTDRPEESGKALIEHKEEAAFIHRSTGVSRDIQRSVAAVVAVAAATLPSSSHAPT